MNKLLFALAWFSFVASASEQVGQTYSVVESDLLSDIEDVARDTDWPTVLNKEQDEWSAFSGVPLPEAQEDKVRRFIPWHTTDFEIKDPRTGKVLYPKGFTFNPLQYVSMPFRILVVGPSHDDWLLANLTGNDNVIYTHGNVIKKSNELDLKRAVYVLNHEVVNAMKLEKVPSIVEQYNQAYQITEIDIDKWRKENEK